jgi:D-arabinose 5-phosphate isomerase GutQ
MKQEDILKEAKYVIRQEADAVLTLPDQLDDHFTQAVLKMLDCKGHVLVSGSGTSHAVARRMAHLLSCCGTPALPLDAGDSQHGLSGAVTANDILIALSKGGRTSEVITLAKVARERGAFIIAITEKPDSELGSLSDIVLKVVAPADVDPYGMVATGSSLFNCALGDAICVVLLKLRGYSLEQFGKTHPGGAVGKKLEDMNIH